MATDIKCPNCSHLFSIEDAVSEEYKKELRLKMETFKKQKEDEFAKREKELIQLAQHKETEFARKLQEEKVRLQQTLEENLRKTIAADFETQLRLLQQSNKSNEEKLAQARQKELDFLQKEQLLKDKEAELELSVQRKVQEEREKLSEEMQKQEDNLRKTISADFENKLRLLEHANKDNEEKLHQARQKELEFLQKEQELKNKEAELEVSVQRKVQEERAKLSEEMQKQEENLRKTISADFENKLRVLEHTNKDNEEKLNQARQKELEFLQKEQELKTKEAELEISVQRKLQEERTKLSEELRKLEEQKTAARDTEYQLRLRELEKQLEDQKKLADEMRRKAEQRSMQLQGEVQELILEEMLRSSFPFDLVCEVGKGVRGADCTLTIRNNVGQECGKIIFESKRTKHFDKNWIEKLKADMRNIGADVGVIVTQALPEEFERFGQLEGIWICSFSEVSALVHVLRDGILKIAAANRSQENRGDKMHMLYDYLTGNEFSEQWKAIREGFQAMKLSIQKERDAMEKLWKAREKQLEKVLLNAAHIKGSIEGIAGSDNISLNLLDDDDSMLLD